MAVRSTITEDVTTQVDGATAIFTVAGGPFVPGSLVVEHNGIRLRSGALFDFTEAATFDGFTLLFVPRVGDTLQAQFELEDIGFGVPLVVASGIDPTC